MAPYWLIGSNDFFSSFGWGNGEGCLSATKSDKLGGDNGVVKVVVVKIALGEVVGI